MSKFINSVKYHVCDAILFVIERIAISFPHLCPKHASRLSTRPVVDYSPRMLFDAFIKHCWSRPIRARNSLLVRDCLRTVSKINFWLNSSGVRCPNIQF